MLLQATALIDIRIHNFRWGTDSSYGCWNIAWNELDGAKYSRTPVRWQHPAKWALWWAAWWLHKTDRSNDAPDAVETVLSYWLISRVVPGGCSITHWPDIQSSRTWPINLSIKPGVILQCIFPSTWKRGKEEGSVDEGEWWLDSWDAEHQLGLKRIVLQGI